MSDWIPQAAQEAWDRLAVDLEPKFGRKEWSEFSARVEESWERLFSLVHRLYGWRYDFAWTLGEILDVAARGYRKRRKALRRLDREPLAWVDEPSSLWAMTDLDRYAGNAKGLVGRLDHLEALGVTHLLLFPPYRAPDGPNDGGYAVSDYRQLRPDLGTMRDLRRAIDKLRQQGIAVALDLVCSHTAHDHRWALAAAAGDPRYEDFYFFFPDRRIPDEISRQLRPISPDRNGDAFTWLPDSGRWVWTTFHPFQWDLNYRNPRVLAAVAREMLFIANLGVAAIRMDAMPFLWKEPGTASENRPEAHFVVQILRIVADLACPSVVFISEAITDEVASFVNPSECRLGFNPLLMTSIWDALATEDVRFLATALGERFELSAGCRWLNYLRSHEPIGWGFADEDAYRMGVNPYLHRRYLDDFYSGGFPGSFARGELVQEQASPGNARISGSLASLVGLESALAELDPLAIDRAVDRMLAAFAVMVFATGIPLLMIGDETASLSDHRADTDLAGDTRWSQRHRFSPDAFASASEGNGPEGRVLSGLLTMLQLRRALPALAPPISFPTGDRSTIGFDAGPVVLIVNLGRQPAVVSPPAATHDLLRSENWGGNVLAPYEFRILANPVSGRTIDA